MVVGGGLFVWRTFGSHSAHTDAPIGTPASSLISFPLDKKPVPGWRLTAADIGLPPDVTVGALFTSTADHAYFVADKTDPQGLSPMGWLYGVDIHSGKLLFPPIALAGFRGYPLGECYGNGPAVAVCLTTGDAERGLPQTAWVIDLEHGQITFTGPTDLNPQGTSGPDKYIVTAIGNYFGETRLVARREGEGVYGIGSNAQRTWFVPGGGSIFDSGYRQVTDVPAPTIATQNAALETPDAPYRMFSAVDGTDLTPTPPEGTIIRRSLVYNQGFAYSFRESGKHDGLLFYDTKGNLVGRYQDKEHDLTPVENPVMPMARVPSKPATWQVFSSAGEPVLSIPAPNAAIYFKVIGSKIFVDQGGTEDRWQQWDLQTGESGSVCQMGLSYDYVGSDGSVIIVSDGAAPNLLRAVDPATCTTLWEIAESEERKGLGLWRVGTGLIQHTEYELTQLTAGP
ncbi:hypothetical protein A5779_15570 [Mycolicibacterium peregrinum]|uniref:Pyrrolo-quinoline quinone n=1 Tax=Mycolicibacterium peregrinum TaxID=43304 RepID=A0A1A0WFM1_MYCPR|nr:hypothetical protein A5779_15570 [Mycolicibacterium peregrinum]